jgi:hypothetical protein
MKSKHKFISYLTILIGICLSNCKKLIEINPPTTELVTKSVFSDDATATSAMTAIYAQMSGYSYPISLYTGLSSDELINYSPSTLNKNLFKNALNGPSDGSTIQIWQTSYPLIYQANSIIENVQNSSGLSSIVKQQLLGEAKFVRAFWHFYLVNIFGNVPLVLSSDYNKTQQLPASSPDQIYQQIIADLKDAQQNLNSNFVDLSDTAITTDRVRPTKWAAMALLARSYLYIGDFANAETLATAIINNTAQFNLETDPNNVFLANSAEAILQIMPPASSTGYNTDDGYFFILTGAPNSQNSSTLNNEVLNSFEAGDKRYQAWVDSIVVGGTTYFFPYKYKVNTGTTPTEYLMVFRLAEQYLIRAEARANQGKISASLDDLNIIRYRAGLPNAKDSTKADLLQQIQHERQIELFTEWGHRWLDLKRTKAVDSIMNSVTPKKGGAWQTTQQLYPIPPRDLLIDFNLKQNPGY